MFSLKKPLFSQVRRELVKDGQAMAEETREGRRVVLANRPPEPGRTG